VTDRRTVPGIDTSTRIVATAAVGVAVEAGMAFRFGWAPPLGPYLCFGAAGTVVSATDLAVRRVPNRVVFPSLAAGGALLALASGLDGAWWPLARAGIAGMVLAGFYLALGLAFPSGMGMGDVKWAGVIGLFLGWFGWPAVVTGTLLAFVAAALAIMVLRIAGRAPRGLSLPMAPFMTVGALVTIWMLR